MPESATPNYWEQAMAELTNRELLKEFRFLKQFQSDIIAHKEQGRKTYLGVSVNIRLFDARRRLRYCTKEVEKRGYVVSKIKLTTKSKKDEQP